MRRVIHFAVLFAFLFAFWIALSGQHNALFLGMGAVSAAAVTLFSLDLVVQTCRDPQRARGRLALRAWYAVCYVAWVLVRLPAAGAQLAYFVLHPRMPLEPRVLRVRVRLRSPVARAMLANSITLIPGTLTVTVDGDEYCVHAFVPSAASDLVDGTMQRVVGRVFLEPPDEDLQTEWEAPPGTQNASGGAAP